MLFTIQLEDGREVTVRAHRLGRALDFIGQDTGIERVE